MNEQTPASPSELVGAIRRERGAAALERDSGHDRTADRHLEAADVLIERLLDGFDGAHMHADSRSRRFIVVSQELAEGGEFRDLLDAPSEEAALERVKRMREGFADVLYASPLADHLDDLWRAAAKPPDEVEQELRVEETLLLGEAGPTLSMEAIASPVTPERSR